MKLRTVLELNENIVNLNLLLEKIEEDYIKQIDDDLWTMDLPVKPEFVNEYDVKIESTEKLTKKYLIRFCEDFGLSLKDFKDEPELNKYIYIFEDKKDILDSLKLIY